jgi:hypothetical protein
MKTRPHRGLQDVPTRSSLTSEVHNPHRKYLRVANLELRRTLCRKVRDAALKRAGEMENQMTQIEREEAQLLAADEAAQNGGARRPTPTNAARRCPVGALRPTLPSASPAAAGDGQTAQPRTVTLKY